MAKVKRTGRPQTLPTLGLVANDGDVIDVPSAVAKQLAKRDGWSMSSTPKKAKATKDEETN